MSKGNDNFKVGDRVRFVSVPHHNVAQVGDLVTVVEYDGEYCDVRYSDGKVRGGYYPYRFELVLEYPNPPHKHAELIKAWADGADIEMMCNCGWEDCVYQSKPSWSANVQYRIKPQRSDKDIQKDAQIERLEQQALDLANEIKKLKE